MYCKKKTCHFATGCSQCKRNRFKIDQNHKCIDCQETFGGGCLHCSDYIGCQQCDSTNYIRQCDYTCGVFYCKEKQNYNNNNNDNNQQFVQFICPTECENQPCDCSEPDLNCAPNTCHSHSGCSQCKPNYFKKDYDHKCASCDTTFGGKCLHCGDFQGCQQCKQEYERRYDPSCGLYYCYDDSIPTPSPTMSPTCHADDINTNVIFTGAYKIDHDNYNYNYNTTNGSSTGSGSSGFDSFNSNWCYQYRLKLKNLTLMMANGYHPDCYVDHLDTSVRYWNLNLTCNNNSMNDLGVNDIYYDLEEYLLSVNISSPLWSYEIIDNAIKFFPNFTVVDDHSCYIDTSIDNNTIDVTMCFDNNLINASDISMVRRSEYCIKHNFEDDVQVCRSTLVPDTCFATEIRAPTNFFPIDYVPVPNKTYSIDEDPNTNGTGFFTIREDLVVVRGWWIKKCKSYKTSQYYDSSVAAGEVSGISSETNGNHTNYTLKVILDDNYIDESIFDGYDINDFLNINDSNNSTFVKHDRPILLPGFDRWVVPKQCLSLEGRIIAYQHDFINGEFILYLDTTMEPYYYFKEADFNVEELLVVQLPPFFDQDDDDDDDNDNNDTYTNDTRNEIIECTILETDEIIRVKDKSDVDYMYNVIKNETDRKNQTIWCVTSAQNSSIDALAQRPKVTTIETDFNASANFSDVTLEDWNEEYFEQVEAYDAEILSDFGILRAKNPKVPNSNENVRRRTFGGFSSPKEIVDTAVDGAKGVVNAAAKHIPYVDQIAPQVLDIIESYYNMIAGLNLNGELSVKAGFSIQHKNSITQRKNNVECTITTINVITASIGLNIKMKISYGFIIERFEEISISFSGDFYAFTKLECNLGLGWTTEIRFPENWNTKEGTLKIIGSIGPVQFGYKPFIKSQLVFYPSIGDDTVEFYSYTEHFGGIKMNMGWKRGAGVFADVQLQRDQLKSKGFPRMEGVNIDPNTCRFRIGIFTSFRLTFGVYWMTLLDDAVRIASAIVLDLPYTDVSLYFPPQSWTLTEIPSCTFQCVEIDEKGFLGIYQMTSGLYSRAQLKWFMPVITLKGQKIFDESFSRGWDIATDGSLFAQSAGGDTNRPTLGGIPLFYEYYKATHCETTSGDWDPISDNIGEKCCDPTFAPTPLPTPPTKTPTDAPVSPCDGITSNPNYYFESIFVASNTNIEFYERINRLYSDNCKFYFSLEQSDRNLHIYYHDGTEIWDSGAHVPDLSWQTKFRIQSDGNLVLSTFDGTYIIWTGVQHLPDVNGNLLLYLSDIGSLYWIDKGNGGAIFNTLSHVIQQAPTCNQWKAMPGIYDGSVPAGTRMEHGHTIVSPNCNYAVQFQWDNNLVIYSLSKRYNPDSVWSSQTFQYRLLYGWFSVQTDGNLVIRTGGGSQVWSSNTAGQSNPGQLVMQNDGNLVYERSTGGVIWSRF